MFIKPKAGLKVRDDVSLMHLAPEGEEKPESNYWVRRLTCGDVIACAPAPVVLNDQISDSGSELA